MEEEGLTDPEARKIAEQYAAEIKSLLDQGVPKHAPFVQWLADWLMTFRTVAK